MTARMPLVEAAATSRLPADDPLMWLSRIRSKANSLWLKHTYPFDSFGRRVSIHHSCEIRRCYSHKIRIGDSVLLDREVWLNVPTISEDESPILEIGSGANVGRRCVISAANHIRIEDHVLFAPGVFVTDHNHEFSDPDLPISAQGINPGGRIVIERNCWLGYGSMVLGTKNEVVIGRNSVVGAYSVVMESCPPNSVLVGNPAKVVKQFDRASGIWKRC
jgi:acetyltransferase-like isoleucine patch superfamily enzyme